MALMPPVTAQHPALESEGKLELQQLMDQLERQQPPSSIRTGCCRPSAAAQRADHHLPRQQRLQRLQRLLPVRQRSMSPGMPDPSNEAAIRELIGHGKLLEGLLLGVQSQVQTSLTQLAETNGRMERLEDRINRLERDTITNDQLKALADTVAALATAVADKPSIDQLQTINGTLSSLSTTVSSLKTSNDRRRGGLGAANAITNMVIAVLAMLGTVLGSVAAMKSWVQDDDPPAPVIRQQEVLQPAPAAVSQR